MTHAMLYMDGEPSGIRVRVADSWASRARGLLGTRLLADDEGLWLRPCDSVHTFGMAYTIDVAFFDREGRVVKVAERLVPWRIAGCWRAKGTLELAKGTLSRLGLRPGMQLALNAT